jgi:hypothetical protein
VSRARATGPSPLHVGLGALAFAAACFGIYELRERLNRRFESSRRVLDDANVLRPEVARALSLGHTEWATDVLWINASIYYGESLFAHLPARYIDRYADSMIKLDPAFRAPYLWGAASLLYRTVAPTRDDVLRAGEFLRQGVVRFPTDPEMHLELGMYLAFERAKLEPRGSPAAAAFRAGAGEHLRFAATVGVGPPWLPLTAATMLLGAHRQREAVDVLCDGLIHTADAATFSMMETRLAELLRGHAEEDPLASAFLETARSRRRAHPWMSPTLHVFVGESILLR